MGGKTLVSLYNSRSPCIHLDLLLAPVPPRLIYSFVYLFLLLIARRTLITIASFQLFAPPRRFTLCNLMNLTPHFPSFSLASDEFLPLRLPSSRSPYYALLCAAQFKSLAVCLVAKPWLACIPAWNRCHRDCPPSFAIFRPLSPSFTLFFSSVDASEKLSN